MTNLCSLKDSFKLCRSFSSLLGFRDVINLSFDNFFFLLNLLIQHSSELLTASSHSEVLTRKQEEKYSPGSTKIKSQTPVAIIKKNLAVDSVNKGTLACTIPWGYGWGWVTLPNGIWNGALTWSQCDDAILLHALPSTDCTNIVEGCEVYNHIGHVESQAYSAAETATIEDIAAEDYDYAVDCGDFIF